MNRPDTETREHFQPAHPTLVAAAVFTVWVAVLSLPMLAGKWLAGPWSDQYTAGLPFRGWGAEWWRAAGDVPLWNPLIFGGLPFLGAGHGDVFHPMSLLRLVLPTTTVTNLGFVIHCILAGLLLYVLLRLLRVSWSGAVLGGAAYQLSGILASLVQPGHDAKLFVSAMLPLALIGLVLALRDRRLSGYSLVALAVALSLLSAHYQMTYYMLVGTGIFALYLTFGEPAGGRLADRMGRLGIALGAVALGFGIAMIHILPFYHYIPFSPRAEGYHGFEGATSWAVPWSHVPEFFFAGFVGSRETYWGANFAKLHSEYLGLPVVALAILGAADRRRRRLVLWLGAIGLLFLLVSLGAGTPFYRLWWAVMPFMQKVRAAGMAFFLVAFVVSVLAAFGVERLERGEAQRWGRFAMIAGVALGLLALAGLFGWLAESLAQGIEMGQGRGVTAVAVAAAPDIRLGALVSATALALAGALAWAFAQKKLTAQVFAFALALLVGGDLWWNARGFWTYSDRSQTAYVTDPITSRLRATPLPYRVLHFPGETFPGFQVYPGSALMAFGIPQVLGYHGNELHNYDELLGGKNRWNYVVSPRLWDLLAVQYVVLPAGSVTGFTEAYKPLISGVTASSGRRADLLVKRDSVRYARLVPGAVKLEQGQAIATIVDPMTGFHPDRLVLLDPEAAVDPPALQSVPDPLDVTATVEAWQPGRMTIHLRPPAPEDAYLVVSENWYPGWRATVDGQPVETLRGNVSLITVPVRQGAARVDLWFHSEQYAVGKLITWISLIVAAAGIVVPAVLGRRRG